MRYPAEHTLGRVSLPRVSTRSFHQRIGIARLCCRGRVVNPRSQLLDPSLSRILRGGVLKLVPAQGIKRAYGILGVAAFYMNLHDGNRTLLSRRVANAILLTCCLVTLCVILVAGLSPFTSRPRNEVRWLGKSNGLYFGEYASILSDAPLRLEGSPDGACSVELWMQPGDISDSNTMLAFYVPGRDLQFSVEQLGDGVLVERKPARSTTSI